MMRYDVGSIVQSRAGKDKGMFFVVSKIEHNFVFLVDGKKRTLSKPKKKKNRHLIVCQQCSELKEKFAKAQYMLDSEIKSVLRNFKLNM